MYMYMYMYIGLINVVPCPHRVNLNHNKICASSKKIFFFSHPRGTCTSILFTWQKIIQNKKIMSSGTTTVYTVALRRLVLIIALPNSLSLSLTMRSINITIQLIKKYEQKRENVHLNLAGAVVGLPHSYDGIPSTTMINILS